MAEWKDKTGPGYSNHEIVSSESQLGVFKVSIHHSFQEGNKWFTTCGGLYSCSPLEGQGIVRLKAQALTKFKGIMIDAMDDIL